MPSPDDFQPLTRLQTRKIENLARRVLDKHSDEDVRLLANGLLKLTSRMDGYVEALFPVFEKIDQEMRASNCLISEESGVFRLLTTEGKSIAYGKTFRELLIDAAKRL
jgi:hypothetical protein